MENLPSYIGIVFIATAVLTVAIFSLAARSKKTLIILSAWMLLQAITSKTGFYTNTATTPPRFALVLVPPILLIAILFLLPAGRRFIDSLPVTSLTILHMVRIPVEITLFWLFVQRTVPAAMTFGGHNFDILSGITAPLVYYAVFIKKWAGHQLLLLWNILCLVLLLNIVVTAILAAPFRFQQLAFEQPNIAILYFPFVWLPCCIVPIVLFAHLGVHQAVVAK